MIEKKSRVSEYAKKQTKKIQNKLAHLNEKKEEFHLDKVNQYSRMAKKINEYFRKGPQKHFYLGKKELIDFAMIEINNKSEDN
jgi:hypothetical protein